MGISPDVGKEASELLLQLFRFQKITPWRFKSRLFENNIYIYLSSIAANNDNESDSRY